MAPHPQLSDLQCRCGRNDVEWVNFTKKNPGRRFVRCANPVTPCRFWKWIDEPISPLVRSAIDLNLKKSEKKVKLIGFALVVAIIVVIVVLWSGRKCEECKCSCNFGMYELASP